jgi:hypothetical protein
MNGTAASGTTTTASAHPTDNLQGQRFFSVLTNLRQDLTDMLKREMDLLKAECSEKLSCMGRQGMFIGIGAVVALLGVTLLLIGICGFLAFGLNKAGLSPLMSFAIAFFAFGAIVAGAGYFVLNKGIKTLSKTRMAPEQTVRTVKEITKPDTHPIPRQAGLLHDEEDDKSHQVKSARMHAERKIAEVQRESAEIRRRLTPKYLWAATCTAAKRRPKATAGIGASILALGVLLLRRRHHNHA